MITELFIRRPVLSIVISLVVLLSGLMAYFNLSTRLYPKTKAGVVVVFVNYAGADAKLMESFVATPIENALAGVEGTDYVFSTSKEGFARIVLHLKMGTDVNAAVNDASMKVASIRGKLPDGIDDPIIKKFDPDQRPIMFLSFESSSLKPVDISDYLYRVIQPQLQTLTGVASVSIFGPQYAMRIWLDPYRMAAYNVTPSDVSQALTTNNLQSPGGQLESAWQLVNVKTISDLSTAQQFNHLVIKNNNGHLIRIQNVGRAVLGPEARKFETYTNGKRSVLMGIIPTSDANYLDLSKEIHARFSQIIKNLPKAITASVFWDNTKFIRASIKEINKTIFVAMFGVILIMFLFIGSWRVLLIPAVTIPLSLIGVCAAMYLVGYSLNTMTFLAFILAIGMVVDDAIVVSENIHRHILLKNTPMKAALVGAKEIQFAIIAMTLTLATVYLPIFFMKGLVGSLFREFAFTLAGAIIFSGFFALVLSPVMCSRIMTTHTFDHGFTVKVEQLSKALTLKYFCWLSWILKRRFLVLIGLPIILLLSMLLYYVVPSELAPKEDTGAIIAMIYAPTSANLSYTSKYMRQLEPIIKKIPEVNSYILVGGEGGQTNHGLAILDLKPWSERSRTSDDIIKSITPEITSIPGIIAQPVNPSMVPGSNAWFGAIDIQLQTTGDYLELNRIVQKLIQTARKNPYLTNVTTDLNLDQQQANVIVDRNKAGDMGVSVKEIGDAINLALGQPTVSHFSLFGRDYNVVPQLNQNFSDPLSAINALQVRTTTGALVSLSNLVKLQNIIEPQNLTHFQQMRSTSINAGLVPGYTLGEALQYFQKLSKKILPDNMQLSYGGESRLYFETGSQMKWLFLLSIVVIFLVLSAQFESFRDPLIVLLAIPLSTFGALLMMWLTGCTMNIYSEIGLITLIGLISKHGILMVEFANQLQRQGKNIKEAIIEAASVRLRPILMTTCAMILGAMPLVLAQGAGAVSRRQIGLVIVGGMSIGTLFTLFVIPMLYIYLTTRKKTRVENLDV